MAQWPIQGEELRRAGCGVQNGKIAAHSKQLHLTRYAAKWWLCVLFESNRWKGFWREAFLYTRLWQWMVIFLDWVDFELERKGWNNEKSRICPYDVIIKIVMIRWLLILTNSYQMVTCFLFESDTDWLEAFPWTREILWIRAEEE